MEEEEEEMAGLKGREDGIGLMNGQVLVLKRRNGESQAFKYVSFQDSQLHSRDFVRVYERK